MPTAINFAQRSVVIFFKRLFFKRPESEGSSFKAWKNSGLTDGDNTCMLELYTALNSAVARVI